MQKYLTLERGRSGYKDSKQGKTDRACEKTGPPKLSRLEDKKNPKYGKRNLTKQ